MRNDTTIYANGLGIGIAEFWEQTMQLRWVFRFSDPDNFNSDVLKILQQRWRSSLGNTKWEDIPIQEE